MELPYLLPPQDPNFTHPPWRSESQRLGSSQAGGRCRLAPSLAYPARLSLLLPCPGTSTQGSPVPASPSLHLTVSLSLVLPLPSR